MACVALASLMSTIELEFLQPIPRVSLHDDDQAPIKSFLENLSFLQAFLQKESRRRGGAKVRDLEIKIRDYALKAEDDIEIQLSNFLLAKDIDYREKASQKLHHTLQGEAEKATELLKIINSISNEADEDNETQPSVHWLKHASDGSSRCSPELVCRMVGRDGDHTEITNKLVFGDLDLKMISIVGMVGIGKTTLARSVYEDLLVRTYFLVRIWITMPQEYNKNQILRLLLRSISPRAEKKIEKGSPTELAKEVWRQLSYKRYLIVLDNLRDKWNDIRGYFPEQSNGSRILVTTTHFDRYVYSGSFFYIHYMTLLDQNESWDLFCSTISLKECMAPQYEKIRSHIVEICDGLPLSIIAVAKRLSKCNNILKEWEKIKKEIESLGILDRNALALNYNQLSHNLKVCFLYLGVFPKRKEILVKKLIGLWIAEGFLESLEHEELENQGYAYLQKLIDRSLVLICNWSSDGEIKTCRMHSALHSFCVGEAQKEGIFCAVNTVQHSRLPLSEFANSCRWLSLCTHSFDYYVLFSTNNCRSIFFFDEDPETFIPFKLLRILAFVPSPFLQRLSMHLGDLIFLRYLSVTQWFEGLDDVLSSNLNLQTLVFFGSESQLGAPSLHLPSTIWVSPQLRHLELGDMYTVDPPSVVKKNLQTLSWVVAPTHCGKEVYLNFPDLRKLKIFCKEDLEPSQTDGSSSNHIILDNFNNIKWLERLTIWVSMGCTTTLPGLFPSQLKKLKLSGTNVSETDLSVIGRLPRLEYLKLQDVSLGRVWRVANGKFSKLRFLLLEDKKLKQIMVENKSFPSLERLVLRFCYCLREIPYDFAFSSYLKSIELDTHMPSVFSTAKLILEWQWRLGRDRFELIIDGAKYVEEQFEEVFVEQDLIDIGGFTVGATTPTKLIFLLVLYIVGIIIHVLLYGPISRQFVITSLRLPLKGNNWILAVISTCLVCIGFAITVRFSYYV